VIYGSTLPLWLCTYHNIDDCFDVIDFNTDETSSSSGGERRVDDQILASRLLLVYTCIYVMSVVYTVTQ
jgi:hypothetical protein